MVISRRKVGTRVRRAELGILGKGIIIIAIPVVFQFVFLGFMFHMQRLSEEADRWALHGREVIAQAEQTFRLLVQAHAAVRGYVLTHNDVFRQQIDSFTHQFVHEITQLRAMVADNPQQQARVDQFRAATLPGEQWMVMMEKLVQSKQYELAYTHVVDLSGKHLVDSAQAELNRFLQEEQQLDEVRVGRVQAAARRERAFLIGGALVSLLLGFGLIVFFARGISRRLKTLAENARRLGVGEQLVAPVRGNDEVATLDRVLHQTSDELRRAAEAEQRYKSEIEKRAAELAEVNLELEQKTAENETFVYSVSHDLRSPLVNLQGFTKELAHSCDDLRNVLSQEGQKIDPQTRKRLDELLERDMSESMHFIKTAVARSGNIIDALLRLSRAGRFELQPRNVDVATVVRRVVDALKGSIHERGAEVIVHELPPCWGDESAIERIFGNLIGNAVNYLSPQRKGIIEIGSSNPKSNGHAVTEDQIVYYVKDNGLGIPAAYLPKMFIAFQRLHGDVAKGEGIGLAVVRRMVERLGGRVWVDSTEGAGSTFFVALPGKPVKTSTGTAVAGSELESSSRRTP